MNLGPQFEQMSMGVGGDPVSSPYRTSHTPNVWRGPYAGSVRDNRPQLASATDLMSAEEAAEDHEFRVTANPRRHDVPPGAGGLFHGTAISGLDEILPSRKTGARSMYKGLTNPDSAYAAKNESIAWAYAHQTAAELTDAPVVYEVQPKADDVEQDMNYGRDDPWTNQAVETPSGFDVKRELRMPAPGMTGDTVGLDAVQGRLFPIKDRAGRPRRWYQTTAEVLEGR